MPALWPVPQPLTPVLSITGGSCATLFAPCPAISRLGLLVWFSGQYLGTGLGGDPRSLTMGGSIDISMEVANRFAVSASIPGALVRSQDQSSETIWGIGGPVEARARVRLGPVAPAFFSISRRPLWSSVVELRTQFLLPDFDGAPRYVGRVQHGVVQPAVYGAGELNLWRFQLAPGVGILIADREAHADLSLRASVQLLDRLFGDVEVLRRQALAVPKEPGRCQSAWMGSAGLRMQFGRGVFVTTRYVGGQGDCVPEHTFMLNLGLAFGEGFMRIPTPDEVGFIKKWHALLMGMVDPILDCQGIMRADDGTPMFRFGSLDARDPRIIWRNHVAYHVGEHFWEKNGNLYRDTDLSTPVLDLHGETPLDFAERAAMHDCPTLPGLGSPCQVSLNLPALRQKVEQGTSPVQVALTEDAQILACLNHLSPLKAAALFAAIQNALGPLLTKLPLVAEWPKPAVPRAPMPSAPAAIAAVPAHAPPSPPGGLPKVATPTRPITANRGQRSRPARKLGRSPKPAEPDLPWGGLPPFPALPGWHSVESSGEVADNAPPASSLGPSGLPPAATNEPSRPVPFRGKAPPPPRIAQHEPPPVGESQAPKAQTPSPPLPTSAAAEPMAPAPASAGEHASPPPESEAPLCGTKCKLLTGAGLGLVAAEVGKDVAVVTIAGGGESMIMSVAGVTSGAVVAKIAADGAADHVMPPNRSTEPARPVSPDKPASSAENTASGENTDQPTPKRGTFKGDLTRLEREAAAKNEGNWRGAQGELDAIERLLQEGKNVEKLPDRGVPGQTEPDLLVDGKLREIKTRHEPLSDKWIKGEIHNSNKQIKNSGYENPYGSVDLQLENQVETDSQLIEKAERSVRGQFKTNRGNNLTDVRLYNNGRLISEWSRVGNEVVRTFSVLPE